MQNLVTIRWQTKKSGGADFFAKFAAFSLRSLRLEAIDREGRKGFAKIAKEVDYVTIQCKAQ